MDLPTTFLTGEAGSEAGNWEESEKLGETPEGHGVPADVGSVDDPFSLRAAESSESDPLRRKASRLEDVENLREENWSGIGG